jgi:MFS family permease
MRTEASPVSSQPKHLQWPLKTGTLTYTKAAVFTLFTWLLWGDFSFTLMEAVWPSVLPLKLNSLGASNTIISLLVTTIPSAMNFVLNPVISTISDRHRGKRGRRIPFLLFATPFVAGFLIFLGFSKQLGAGLFAAISGLLPDWMTENMVVIGIICVLVISFRFFELFINTIYWYLFNDVVPQPLMGRFLALFRVVGALAGALYNFFVYKYAATHSGEIFVGAGVIYGVVFLLMCLNIREGTYPPPEPIQPRTPWFRFVVGFLRECFGHRVYVLLYFSVAAWVFSSAGNPFHIFFATSLGLTIEQVGFVSGISILAGIAFAIPAGFLVDRFHPIRVMLAAKIGLVLIAPFNLIFLFRDFPPHQTFWIYMALNMVVIPLGAVYTAAGLPMAMRTLPRDRYGQFSSASAMVVALAIMAGGILVGLYLDTLKTLFQGNPYYYRFLPCWPLVFCCVSIVLNVLLYREWKRLGGDSGFKPPVSDAFARKA